MCRVTGVLHDGDLVKLDLVATKEGFFADAAVTVPVGHVSRTADALVRCAEVAFWQLIIYDLAVIHVRLSSVSLS